MTKQKLSEYKNDYYFFSGKLSDINRQIAFAGIALIWIFKVSVGDKIVIDHSLLYSAKFIVVALALDLLHYLYQTITWSLFYTVNKKKYKSEDHGLDSSMALNIPAWILFYLKIALVLIAYVMIFYHLAEKLSL
jgi:hypothetical protein